MAEIKIDIDSGAVNSAIDNALRIGDTSALMRRVGRVARTDVDLNFRQGVSPDGEKWAPVLGRSGQPLRDSGNLQRSITEKTTKDEAQIGTNVEYAAIHNFGGIIKPKNGKYLSFRIGGRFAKVKQVVIPQRQFIGIGDRLVDKVNRAVEKWAEEVLENGVAQ